MTCPGDIELARAVGGEPDAELAAHLETCGACRAARDEARAAIELARELPVALPSPSRREEVRTALLAAAADRAQRPARHARVLPTIAGAAAAVVAAYLAIAHTAAPPLASSSPSPSPSPSLSPSPSPHTHGAVRPRAGAHYVVRSIGPDEVIELSEGAIDIEVEPLHPGERFRVVVGRSELEVRGTAFSVTASAEHLVEVAVAHGRVDLSPGIGAPATLAAGQSWRADGAGAASRQPEPPGVMQQREPEPAASAARREPEPPATAVRRGGTARAGAARRDAEPTTLSAHREVELPIGAARAADAEPAAPPPRARAAEETSYDDAWVALRSGEFARAAGEFARVVLLAPDSPLVEDASFWRAVALARGKRSLEAVSALHDFLGLYARSARAGEASAILGWLLIDAGAFDEAARRFDAAAGDPDPAVRRSARSGLDALAHRKH